MERGEGEVEEGMSGERRRGGGGRNEWREEKGRWRKE